MPAASVDIDHHSQSQLKLEINHHQQRQQRQSAADPAADPAAVHLAVVDLESTRCPLLSVTKLRQIMQSGHG